MGGARRHVEAVGPDLGVDFQCPGQQVEPAQVGAVQPRPFDRQATFGDVETQGAIRADDGLARGQRGAVGVEETAAVATNAGGVGDDDAGAMARHFQHARQLGRIGCGDLVQDDARMPVAQHGIAGHRAGQLRLAARAAVVQHHARGADIELGETVVGNAAGRRRRDVDHRHAAAHAHHGPLAGHALVHGDGQGLRQRGRPDLRGQHQPDNQGTKRGHERKGSMERTDARRRARLAGGRPDGRVWQ
ncbi:Uncharacterised protein [Achromobacter xylosoxidans]|nr:Uncharacterised protein [Achromobacter xylosoxidans]